MSKIFFTEAEYKTTEKVAKFFGNTWKNVDYEDILGELYLWLTENYKYVERWREETGDGKLFVSLRRHAAKFCAKTAGEKYADPGLTNNLKYTFSQVENTLPHIFEENIYEQLMTMESQKLFDIIFDVYQTFHGMKNDDKRILALRYHYGKTSKEIGEMLNLKDNTVDKRIERALKKLHSSIFIDKEYGESWESTLNNPNTDYIK
jgi:RNA polymerase sigma factor (sigma-70 family)